MQKALVPICLLVLITGCTAINVRPVDPSLQITNICIEENPKVIVEDFLSVVRDRIEYHGIETAVLRNPDPDECEYIMTYTAFKTWDVVSYLHHAELRLERNGRTIGKAEYHLKGQGGFSLMKWQSTKTKMDPVVDELLGKM